MQDLTKKPKLDVRDLKQSVSHCEESQPNNPKQKILDYGQEHLQS
jgi:hypothetical protein